MCHGAATARKSKTPVTGLNSRQRRHCPLSSNSGIAARSEEHRSNQALGQRGEREGSPHAVEADRPADSKPGEKSIERKATGNSAALRGWQSA